MPAVSTLDTRSILDILVIEAEYKYKNIKWMFAEKLIIDHSVGLGEFFSSIYFLL